MADLRFEKRKVDNPALEETLGIPKQGFYDPDCEFPKQGYKNENSINKAARGSSTVNIDIGGGHPGVSISRAETLPSVYPYNDVKETPSGHIISLDDTVGNERITFKHRTGAGIEIDPDGRVTVISKSGCVEVVSGNHHVIVEGHGKMVYNGNFDLEVTGDMNLTVGGDYNLKVKGDVSQYFYHDVDTTIIQNETKTVKGSSTLTIQDNLVVAVGSDIEVSAESDFTVNASLVTMSFEKGAIGGDEVDFTGETVTADTFHGALEGNAKTATQAGRAGTAAALGAGGSAGSEVNTSRDYEPTVDLTDVSLDTVYVDLANSVLTLHEVRSKLRDPNNITNTVFTNKMIADGILSSNFQSTSYTINRRSSTAGGSRKGETPIGNTPPTFATKKFIP